ncbi:MAG TPA: hybrid sensor histidine kinase/response regulator [Vicinamibacterales bacterium]|nr:hybrid sensor histidine kinase/response regulator [Vicinamibacterales bacterium]
MLNFVAIIGLLGAAAGLLMAAFSFGMSRSPIWSERRPFAMVAATAAGYCAFDVVLVLDLPADTIAASVQVALAFAVAHCASWVWYLASIDERPLYKSERAIIVVGVLIAAAGFVPGLLITRELFTFTVSWLGVTYRTPQPTAVGLACYGYLCAGMILVGRNARHRWHEGWHARLPIAGAVTLAVLAVNDTLASAGVIEMPLLLDLGSIILATIVCIMHERRFNAKVHRFEHASLELRHEVETRTRAMLDAQAALAANERLAGLGRLTAGVAHEINNPIAVVQHSLERIRDLGADGRHHDQARYVDGALAATDRVVRIVRRLLDAGRVGTNDIARVEPFHVAPVLRNAIGMVERHLAGVHVSVDTDEGLTALGDPGLVSQVIENLIVNATHALESRPRDPRIHLRAERDGGQVRVSVTDNGPGIPETVQERLFEPFVTTKAIGRGSGLGLAVSKGLMRSQQGDLRMLRTSAEGTEMALHLPWTDRQPEAPAPLAAVTGERANLKLLIVDDEPDVREMLHDVCSVLFDVSSAGSIKEALERVQGGAVPDVVLCDLMMPDGGAHEWLEQCRPRYGELAERTVIITGGPANPRDEELLAAYADRVLFKPFSLSQLQRIVAKVAASPERLQSTP